MGENVNNTSVILLTGDAVLSHKEVFRLKQKLHESVWRDMSLDECSEDDIRTACSMGNFGNVETIVLIRDFPNRKAFRTFLLDLINSSSDSVGLVIWDSNNHIKNSKSPPKAWESFIKEIKKLTNHKIVDSGSDFGTKWQDRLNAIKYIQDGFKAKGLSIGNDEAALFFDLVGGKRSLLISEIEKIALNNPQKITHQYILENIVVTSNDALIYKLGDLIDKRQIGQAISKIDEFINAGIYYEIIAETLAKKARWQLAAANMLSRGFSDYEAKQHLMTMGTFPSTIWHHKNMQDKQKDTKASEYNDVISVRDYFVNELGMPAEYFSDKLGKHKQQKSGTLKGECLPHSIVADKTVAAVRKIENTYHKNTGNKNWSQILTYIESMYFLVIECLKQIRYDSSQHKEQLNKMVFVLAGITSY